MKTGESNDCEGVKGRGTLSTDSYTENLPWDEARQEENFFRKEKYLENLERKKITRLIVPIYTGSLSDNQYWIIPRTQEARGKRNACATVLKQKLKTKN